MINQAEQPARDENLLVYVGTYTDGASEGIYLCRLQPAAGALQLLGLAAQCANPSYLALNAAGRRLYAVNENPGALGRISAFSRDPHTGALSLLNQQSSHGGAPCHLALDRGGRHLFVANYMGGNVAVFPIAADGSLREATDVVRHAGSSIHPTRQSAPHPHAVVPDPDGDLVYVPDLGLDRVLQYRLDPQAGRLHPHEQPWLETAPGSGPRHLALHPRLPRAYLVHELTSTVTVHARDADRGLSPAQQTIATLPADYAGPNLAAAVQVHPNGRFLYATNRGHDSLVVFAVDPETGLLAQQQRVTSGGRTPRDFVIDPTGAFLLVANQEGDSVVTFQIDRQTGKLTPTGHRLDVSRPVCLKPVPA
jgi:6-phosphogluconolactonase